MEDIINTIAKFLREHSWTLCYAWTASLLVIYGRALALTAKGIAKTWHFVFRVIFFMIICGLCYGLFMVYVTKFIHNHLTSLANIWYVLTVLCAFLILGIIADRKKYI